ncbi:MAG TPA: stage II sporulation protein M, partial [Chitinophagaceae bacterium]|nr:stage II sporulation protein M [Chitinophagaceae bacterium]
MREALFIKKNKERWERIQYQPSQDADETAKDFTQLLDDLAYAKTFYPSGKVTQYINGQASKIYIGIYQNRKEDSNRLVTFWKYELPLTIRKHHGLVLFTFILFVLFFIIGFFSSGHDPAFVRSVLGENYVDMTEANIAKGNPLGVYQSGNALLAWIGIMINNIMVSFTYFARGLSFGILTVTSVMKEAITLGAFEYMFFSKGFGWQSAMGVLIHGILELTAIIIACAAGLVMVKSFLFPGT